jgi:hypothetical protein
VRDRLFFALARAAIKLFCMCQIHSHYNHLEQPSLPTHTNAHDARMELTFEQGPFPGKRPYSPSRQFTDAPPQLLAPNT